MKRVPRHISVTTDIVPLAARTSSLTRPTRRPLAGQDAGGPGLLLHPGEVYARAVVLDVYDDRAHRGVSR